VQQWSELTELPVIKFVEWLAIARAKF